MGTGSPSKLATPRYPSRPLDAQTKFCIANHWSSIILASSSSTTTTTTLARLILCRDWQRVLIRANLFPKEVAQPISIYLCSIRWKVFPLHLVCALKPPEAVLSVLLKHFVDAAAIPIRPRRKKKGVPFWKIKIRKWRKKGTPENRVPTTTTIENDNLRGARKREDLAAEDHMDICVEKQKSLIPKIHGVSLPSLREHFLVKDEVESLQCSSSSLSSHSLELDCSTDSFQTFLHEASTNNEPQTLDQPEILQLGMNGNVVVLPSSSISNDGTLLSSSLVGDLFRVEWDLQPLTKEVASLGILLPLHVACLYGASASVVDLLIEAYPLANRSPVMGMLPIHLVSAGWRLPPILEGTTTEEGEVGPADTLRVLHRHSKGTSPLRSENHGMTPEEYIEECMEDGDYKDLCKRIVSGSRRNEVAQLVDDCTVSEDSVVFLDSCDGSANSLPSPRDQPCPVCSRNFWIARKNWFNSFTWGHSSSQFWYYGVQKDGWLRLATFNHSCYVYPQRTFNPCPAPSDGRARIPQWLWGLPESAHGFASRPIGGRNFSTSVCTESCGPSSWH